MSSISSPPRGETTTAALAAKALKVSRKTITRMVADGRLEEAGTTQDGERLITMSSLVRQQSDRRAMPTPALPPATPTDPLVVELLDTLKDELEARREEAAQTRERLLLTERSMSTLEAERDALRAERDRAVHMLQDMSRSGPLSRWKKRRELAAYVAGQAETRGPGQA